MPDVLPSSSVVSITGFGFKFSGSSVNNACPVRPFTVTIGVDTVAGDAPAAETRDACVGFFLVAFSDGWQCGDGRGL